jgi:hypothetical protein
VAYLEKVVSKVLAGHPNNAAHCDLLTQHQDGRMTPIKQVCVLECARACAQPLHGWRVWVCAQTHTHTHTRHATHVATLMPAKHMHARHTHRSSQTCSG